MKNPNSDKRSVPLAFLVIALVVAPLLLYLGGYFWLGDAWRPGPTASGGQLRMRVFHQDWLAVVYRPAAWVESQIRGYTVIAGTEEDLYNSSP
jgi:hypothetical protein